MTSRASTWATTLNGPQFHWERKRLATNRAFNIPMSSQILRNGKRSPLQWGCNLFGRGREPKRKFEIVTRSFSRVFDVSWVNIVTHLNWQIPCLSLCKLDDVYLMRGYTLIWSGWINYLLEPSWTWAEIDWARINLSSARKDFESSIWVQARSFLIEISLNRDQPKLVESWLGSISTPIVIHEHTPFKKTNINIPLIKRRAPVNTHQHRE